MKKTIYCVLIVLSGIIVFESFTPLRTKRKDGTDPGYTGSPGDSLKNCTVCHGGTAIYVPDWIAADIPAKGYNPGETYTIKAANREVGATRFGFEVSPQAPNGQMLGTLIITDTGRTQLVGNGKYITYKAAGVDGVDSNTWFFQWVAPPSGTGDVTFYGAFNSNFDDHKTGDHTYLSSLLVKENTQAGISQISDKVSNFTVYPNPSKGLIHVTFDLLSRSRVVADVMDLTGRQVAVIMNENMGRGAVDKTYNTAALAEGAYFVRITVNGATVTQKLSIDH